MLRPFRLSRVRATASVGGRSRVVSTLTVLAALAFAAACESTATTSTGPSAVKCQVALDGLQQAIDASGGSAMLSVRTQPECAWTASAEAGWITSLNPQAGQGDGQIQVQIPANPLPNAREGNVVVNGNRAVVRQAAASCRFDVAPRGIDVDSSAGAGSVTVTTLAGCSWSAVSTVDWIQVSVGSSAAGNGRVEFVVAANPGSSRNGVLTIAGESVTVTQSAAATVPDTPCSYDLTPTNVSIPVSGSASNRIVVTTASDCSWTATSPVPWIAIANGGAGQGAGVVEFSVAANTGPSRTAVLSVAGQSFNVTQAGVTLCVYSIGATEQTLSAAGGTGTPIAVTATAGCAWTASSNAPWLSIVTGSTGSGNGVVTFSAAANTGGERRATLTIAGATFAVVQSAAAPAPQPPPPVTPVPPTQPPAPCAYQISPQTQSIGASGGAGNQVAVSTTAACSWTASTNVNWISITSGTSGTGSGSVAFRVDANAGAQRSGTLTIAGQTFTVTQAAATVPCSYQLSPGQQSIASAGGPGSITVTTAAGCAWTAASNDSWISITSGASGVGGGTVAYTVASNSGSARTGTLTVAGHTFTVQQAAQPAQCSYEVTPSGQTIVASGGNGSAINVKTSNNCSWTAASNVPWLTITSDTTGSGNGSVRFSAAANTGAERVGTLTIAGQTFTVTQSGVRP